MSSCRTLSTLNYSIQLYFMFPLQPCSSQPRSTKFLDIGDLQSGHYYKLHMFVATSSMDFFYKEGATMAFYASFQDNLVNLLPGKKQYFFLSIYSMAMLQLIPKMVWQEAFSFLLLLMCCKQWASQWRTWGGMGDYSLQVKYEGRQNCNLK